MIRNILMTLLVLPLLTISAAAQDVKRILANDLEFAYLDIGSGDPIIFVHGGLQDYRMWAAHLPRFADRYRVIAYSRRNNYPNATSPDGMPDSAADAHGEDLAAIVKALGLSKVRVVGHSSGAHAALFFAAANPEMVTSLVLNEPPATGILIGRPGGAEVLKEFGGGVGPGREALKVGNIDEGIPLFVNGVGGPGAYERRSKADKKMNRDNVASYQADARSQRPRAVFTCEMGKAISAPTLFTDGETSPKFFYRIIDQLALCLPNAERSIIKGSSHTVPGEKPEAFDSAALTFFELH